MYQPMYPGQVFIPYCPFMYRAMAIPEPYVYDHTMEEYGNEKNDGIEDASTEKLSAEPMYRSKGYREITEEDERENMMGYGGAGMEHVMSVDEVLNMIERHHPDIISTMTSGRVTENMARHILRRVIEMAMMHGR